MQGFSVGKEFRKIRKDFTEEEKTGLSQRFGDLFLDYQAREIEVKEEIKELNAEVKMKKTTAMETLKKLKAGFEEVHVECDMIPDYDKGMMNYVDPSTGEIHFSRRLLPEERQMNIHQISEVANA